jgi:hypothetical protein
MKKYLIIYEYKASKFVIQFTAAGLFSALHMFEAEVKLNVDQIVSIDVL